MVTSPGANDAVATASEPQPDSQDPEALAADPAALVRQYKGLQRTNERLRRELMGKVDTDDTREHVRLLRESVDAFTKIIEPALDPTSREQVVKLRTATESAQKKLTDETAAQKKFAEVLADQGIDFDSDEAAVARAFYESGKYDRAIEALDKLGKSKSTTTDAEIEARVEERLKDRGAAVVRPTGSTAGAPLKGIDAAKAVVKNPKATAAELLASLTVLAPKR